MAEIAIAAAVAAAVSAAAYTIQYALTPKAKPIQRGKRSGDIQIQDSRYGHMIPILLGANPVNEIGEVGGTSTAITFEAFRLTESLAAGSVQTTISSADPPCNTSDFLAHRAQSVQGIETDDEGLSFKYKLLEQDDMYVFLTPMDDPPRVVVNPVGSCGLYYHYAEFHAPVNDLYSEWEQWGLYLPFGEVTGDPWDAWAQVIDTKRGAPSGQESYVFGITTETNFTFKRLDGSVVLEVPVANADLSQGDWEVDGSVARYTYSRPASATDDFTGADLLPVNPSPADGFEAYEAAFTPSPVDAPLKLAVVMAGDSAYSYPARAGIHDAVFHSVNESSSGEAGGGMRVAGNVIWMSDVRKVETVTPAEGGKFGNKNPDTVTTSYFCDLAIMFSEGEMELARLFAGTDVLLDLESETGTGARDSTVDPDADSDNIALPDPLDEIIAQRPVQRFNAAPAADANGTIEGTLTNGADFRFYSGSETQLPDPLLEADLGVGSTPAYLGRSYLVLENFEVGKYGYIPNFTAILNNKNLRTAAECLDHLFQRVGFDPSDFDVSNVDQFNVRGIPIVNREPPRNTVELIGKLFGFDVVETDGQMVCVPRGGPATFAVAEEDLGAVEVDGTEDPQSADIPELISNSLELDQTVLPRRVDVNFFDPARNGENNTAGVSRMEGLANGFITEEINAVLTFTEARQLAQRLMDTAWIESAGAIKAQVAHTFAGNISAAAVGTITANDITHTVRVKQVNGFVPGVLEVVGVKTRGATYTQTEVQPGDDAGGVVVNPTTPGIPATTVATFIDRLLRDREIQDGRPGFYVAACSFGNGSWGSANVYCDRGSGYVHLINVPEQATMGIVDAADATITGASTVDVVLYADQTLPTGPAYVLQADLIYRYATATQLSTSPNVWQVTGLTDIGARCTTAENGSHAAGERFVLLNQALRFVAVEESEIGVARDYKVPTSGAELDDCGVISFTIDAPNVAVTTPADWSMTPGNGQIAHSWTPFSDECVLQAGLVYEIREDSAGSPGALIYSGNSVPFVESGLSAGTYTRHFRARTAFSDGAYLSDSVSVTTSVGIGGSTGSIDNAVLRADGTGGSTVQSSTVSISDAGAVKGPTQIEDSNGNEVVKFGTTASAVNEVTITNKDTGNAPTIAATGSDTDIDLSLAPKGAGRVKATDFEITESLRWSGDLSPSQITSDQNDYSPTNLADNTVLRLDTDSNSGAGRSITGLAGGADGRIITVINIGSNPLRLKAENASSTAANRFAFAIDLVLGSKRSAVLWYDSTSSRWRLLSTTAVPLRHTVAISDETTALTTGTAKLTFRFATAVYLLQVRANLNTVSSSGAPAFDVNEAGASIFSTTLTIDASEKSSETAATPAVISDPNIADDAEMTVDIDTAGTGAKGAKLTFIGWEI